MKRIKKVNNEIAQINKPNEKEKKVTSNANEPDGDQKSKETTNKKETIISSDRTVEFYKISAESILL